MGAFSDMDYELQNNEAAVSNAFMEDDDMDIFRCGKISQKCVHVTAQCPQNRGVDHIQTVHDLLRDPLYNTV